MTLADQRVLEEAGRALGQLDGLARALPETALFLYMYVRKEALLSSQIEGTQSSLSELLLFENDESSEFSSVDVVDVLNYVAALEHGIDRLRVLPLSTRLFKELHARLLSRGRGSEKAPGEYRVSQNWIGGTRPGIATYVPPPPTEVHRCMGDLELFLNDPQPVLPLLVRIALAHAQFESIHPFLDGNGRLGRLLITLALVANGALEKPLLYMSLYLKQHRAKYYELLQRTRTHGEWESWIRFFLEGVRDTSRQASSTIRRILDLFDQDAERIRRSGPSAGATASTLRVHEVFRKIPVSKTSTVVKGIELSQPTVDAALNRLLELGIVREVTGRKRHRLYAYDAYMRILQEGTEPLPVG